jgi:hypothetical protein
MYEHENLARGMERKAIGFALSGPECCRGVKGNSRRPLANWETQASAICPQRDKSRVFHVPGNGSRSVLRMADVVVFDPSDQAMYVRLDQVERSILPERLDSRHGIRLGLDG